MAGFSAHTSKAQNHIELHGYHGSFRLVEYVEFTFLFRQISNLSDLTCWRYVQFGRDRNKTGVSAIPHQKSVVTRYLQKQSYNS